MVPAAATSLSESEVSLLGGVGARSRRLVLAVDQLTPPDRLLLAILMFALYLFL